MNEAIVDTVNAYLSKQFECKQFLAAVLVFFQEHPDLHDKVAPVVHSVKSRLKDPQHLAEKIRRKMEDGRTINSDNLFSEITDLIGVRILHLYQEQITVINSAIHTKVSSGDWVFVEEPKALTWDPESIDFYRALGIKTEIRPSLYTSIHYVIKPNNSNIICCEIQVRTLFEEIWGEIDHVINYPTPTDSLACREQLRVLAKLVSTGTRLADSIFRTNGDHLKRADIRQDL
jgi:putative GTP pyrophosphokinase